MKNPKILVKVLSYSDNVLQGEFHQKRVVRQSMHGPYVTDSMHKSRLYLIEKNPPTIRVDSYSVPRNPWINDGDFFPSLKFRGLEHGPFKAPDAPFYTDLEAGPSNSSEDLRKKLGMK